MIFNAELVRFKSMRDGVRLELDVPSLDATRVMQAITNFLEKPLKVDLNIDSQEAVKSFIAITDAQKGKIHMLYTDISNKYSSSKDEVIDRAKDSLLGDKEQSITELSKMQASAYIDQLEAILIKE